MQKISAPMLDSSLVHSISASIFCPNRVAENFAERKRSLVHFLCSFKYLICVHFLGIFLMLFVFVCVSIS